MLAGMGTLSGEVVYLKNLDQTIHELKEQIATSGERKKGKTPLGNRDGP